jgi:hypothetical protein
MTSAIELLPASSSADPRWGGAGQGRERLERPLGAPRWKRCNFNHRELDSDDWIPCVRWRMFEQVRDPMTRRRERQC